jgi:predicted kinase
LSTESAERTRLLVVNGTVGAGKTAVADAVTELLTERGVAHAFIDVDALRRVWPRPDDDPFAGRLVFEHLAAVAPNLARRGYRRVLLAGVVEDPADRERYGAAFDGADVTIVRLAAREATRMARLNARETDERWFTWHARRTVELEQILDAAALDDAVVDNDERPVRDVAAEVLSAADWA